MAAFDPFRRLWLATGISNLGDGVGLVAVPLLAATLTRDPFLVGSVAAVGALPYLLLGIPIGVLVDRVERRRAMVVANVGRGLLLGMFAIAVVADLASIWWLYVVAFAFAVAECVYDNAAEGTVADVVEPERLDWANARLQSTIHVTNLFAGGPLGAFLFAVAAAVPFGGQALGHLVAAGLVAGLPPSPIAERPDEETSAWADLREGLRWLWANRTLRSLALVSGLLAFATQLAQATIVLFVLDELDVSEFGFGVLSMTAALGAVAGSMVAPRLSAYFGRVPTMLAGNVIQPLVLVAIGLSPNAWALGALYALYAGLVGLWNVLSMSLRQELVPPRLYGRVFGAWRTIVWGGLPLGSWCGGLVAREFGLRAPWFAAAIAFAVVAVVGWPALRRAANAGPADQLAGIDGSSASSV